MDYTVDNQERIEFGDYSLVQVSVHGGVLHDLWAIPGGSVLSTEATMQWARNLGYKPEHKIVMVRRRTQGK